MTVTFEIGDGCSLSVAAHVTPTAYDACSVLTAVTRDFALWPGSNAVAGDVLGAWVEGERSRVEGRPAPLSWREPRGALQRGFAALRGEYVHMGYGVPPETALQAHRSDM